MTSTTTSDQGALAQPQHAAIAGLSDVERAIALGSLPIISPHPFVFAVVTGTHHYGFTSPDSDIDVRGAFTPPTRSLLGLLPPKNHAQLMEVLQDREVDGVCFEAGRFCELVLKQAGNVIEELFSPLVILDTGYLEPLRQAVLACLTKRIGRHYTGFFEACVRKIKKKPPGEVKTALYAVRIALSGITVLTDRVVEAHLPTLNETFKLDYVDEWIAMKTLEHEPINDANREQMLGCLRELRRSLHRALDRSALPQEPEAKAQLSDLLTDIRLDSRLGMSE